LWLLGVGLLVYPLSSFSCRHFMIQMVGVSSRRPMTSQSNNYMAPTLAHCGESAPST
jgi:hypothetical protein